MKRESYVHEISERFKLFKAVALLGPRQSGKTTLAKFYKDTFAEKKIHLFDLEDPTDLSRLDSPMLALENLEGLVIIDEIQRRPELFPILRVLIDRKVSDQKFLILGSASRDLISQSSETLAGRITYIEVSPFSASEVRDEERLFIRGGFPKSYLAKTEKQSMLWRKEYISSFLERDIPQLGINIPATQLRRFWMMLTHYHGQIWNASEIGSALSLSAPTMKKYLDILSGTFMIRQLQPWFENISKRQIKSPKIYFRDSGILHTLLGIENKKNLYTHPKLGASWEGFALETVLSKLKVENIYFWGIHSQAELDLLVMRGPHKIGYEFKYTDHPVLTKSMQIAVETLDLKELIVIFPGKVSFPISKKIKAMSLTDFLK